MLSSKQINEILFTYGNHPAVQRLAFSHMEALNTLDKYGVMMNDLCDLIENQDQYVDKLHDTLDRYEATIKRQDERINEYIID